MTDFHRKSALDTDMLGMVPMVIEQSGRGQGYNVVVHEMAHKLDSKVAVGLQGLPVSRVPVVQGMVVRKRNYSRSHHAAKLGEVRAILGRRHAAGAFEQLAEMRGVVIADGRGHGLNRRVVALQHRLRRFDVPTWGDGSYVAVIHPRAMTSLLAMPRRQAATVATCHQTGVGPGTPVAANCARCRRSRSSRRSSTGRAPGRVFATSCSRCSGR